MTENNDAPTWANQLRMANELADKEGISALENPHAMTGRICGCGSCFCCAALQVCDERAFAVLHAELERLRDENLRLRGLAQLTLDDIEAFDAQCTAEHYTDTEEAWIIMGKLAALARTLLADPQPAKVPA
jgi:hypothetical protein